MARQECSPDVIRPDIVRLANARSIFYAQDREEGRWLDARLRALPC
ncbi:MAG TPA: hypothetical protein VH678_21585 [Xanthobacteraceae bacterium]|jgi:hypothetical protein